MTQEMQNNPKSFDEVQKRIRKIIQVREGYNILSDELIDVLVNEPENNEKKLAMIAQLEELEKDPNPTTRLFVKMTKDAAQFMLFKARYESITDEGLRLISEKNYEKAISTYTSGFSLYRENFNEYTANNPDLLRRVNDTLRSIEYASEDYAVLQSDLHTATARFIAYMNTFEYQSAANELLALEKKYRTFAEIRNTVAEAGWFFKSTFALLQSQDSNLTDASFLPFAYRFVLGPNETDFDGILGVFDSHWNDMQSALKNSLSTAITTQWQNSAQLLLSHNDKTPTSAIQPEQFLSSVDLCANMAMQINGYNSFLKESTGVFHANPYPTYTAEIQSVQTILAALNNFLADIRVYTSFEARYQSYTPPTITVSSIRSGTFAKPTSVSNTTNVFSFMLYASSLFNDALTRSTQENVFLASLSRTHNATSFSYAFMLDDYQDFLELYISLYTGLLQNAWFVFVNSAQNAAQALSEEDTGFYTQATQLLNGVRDPQSSLVSYYPKESSELMQKTLNTIQSDITVLHSLYAQTQSAPLLVSEHKAYSTSQNTIKEYITKLERLTKQGTQTIADAKIRIQQAALAESEAVLRYNQARASLSAGNFQNARDGLQRSRSKYNESLTLQESASLRSSSDAKLLQLGEDINRLENDIVVRDVRSLITQGKSLYSTQQFEKAEQVFLQAKTRWSLTNSEENPEITSWLSLVGTALSIKSGRVILPTAPLYAEMSQILSISNQLYNEGKTLINAGKRSEGVVLLNSAADKLRDLQIVYPLNQDASLLMLRISQVIDQKAFEVSFKLKYDEARKTYRTQGESQRAYSDLLDLYAINPSYSGLKNTIDEVEIYLGMKLPPPDPKKISESNRLTQQAQKIYDAGNRDRYDEAVVLLNNAIQLNSDNNTALLLKDRILTNQGGSAVPVLASTDESLYQKAVQDFQKGNYADADAIVQKLLQNSKNKNSSKILDLQTRIEAVLQ